ncbi:class I SAM-dependent methyltransferase [Oscillatoria sp. FACHB-1406]|uniref:class I SAM-dependent methyltransferase n=1 Tax=Oscillatoria sp. FACHB-1406 TaxID=2692846 RepID=UPI0016878566|nr:class I SAM-dependent methyltransferase [Oscillatoria sp. FACHB-1406]MBD2579381.1 class I SAM-dependent methyltransferase [Oscillatoria sp. FACHB-1406]
MSDKAEVIFKTKAVFNAASDYFDAPALSFWGRFGQATIDKLSFQGGESVLDVCCGSGASALPAARAVGTSGSVVGVDLAESLLELGRNKAKQQGLENIEFRCADFENLGFPDESFDAIVCVFGIFFVPDMSAALQELLRMLRPGGKLAITSWGQKVFEPANGEFWSAIQTERPDLYKSFTPWDRISTSAELKALLESSGATQVEVFPESCTHELTAAEDWWTMVLGGGIRGIIDQLKPAVRERIRQGNLEFLRQNQIGSLEVDVLYAIARKAEI